MNKGPRISTRWLPLRRLTATIVYKEELDAKLSIVDNDLLMTYSDGGASTCIWSPEEESEA